MVLHNALVLSRVVSVPAVPLPVPAQRYFLDDFVWGDVRAGPFCAELAWAGETFFGFVCGGAAVLAGAFAVFGGARELQASVVPFLGGEVVWGGFLETLMLDWGGVLVGGLVRRGGGRGRDVR